MKVYYFIFMGLLSITSYSFAQLVEEDTSLKSKESSIIPEGGPESELVDLSSEQQIGDEIEEQEDPFDPGMEEDLNDNNEVITEEMQ